MRYPKATKEELTAPTGKFRVVGVDVRADSEAGYLIGDFDSLTAAKEVAKQRRALALVVRRAGGGAIAFWHGAGLYSLFWNFSKRLRLTRL